MYSIEICPFTKDCIDDVFRITCLSFATAWSMDSFNNELNNKFARYVVAKCNGKIIGYGGMWIIIDEAHITNIAVHPEFRRTGAASLILENMVKICKLESVISMTLEVRDSNIAARNLYEKFDFAQEGLRKNYYSDTKEDAIIMWKHNI
jgi:ribosomal-protein-alanine N-acetyltransferase